ncbi:hypothetical protein M3649_03375 [Ureibacillus chungkukjangi]|uniref:hypothetical protein n=1 Tax=Ureibacillus chungkukjangi TaxID=1202712 RepID=UPI002041340B|nr:hypothetical protein [Ureibacillus chungkukjangi]MCM3387171.1 hypothetical protein [Ureibacillus chungkukjangi]
MKIKLLIAFLLMFPFVVNLSTTSSFACSCSQPGSAEEEMNRSDFVFSGKVLDIKDNNKSLVLQSSADLLEIRFEVSNTWKGLSETEALIFTERESASCGFNFTIDEEYLVYGNNEGGKKRASLCSKTTLLSEAADLNSLGEGQKPSVEVGKGEEIKGENALRDQSMTIPISIFAIVVVLIILVSYMLVKKSCRK